MAVRRRGNRAKNQDPLGRLVLIGFGAFMVVSGAWFVADAKLADTLIVLGTGTLILGVFLPRLQTFKFGPKGVEASLAPVSEHPTGGLMKFEDSPRTISR